MAGSLGVGSFEALSVIHSVHCVLPWSKVAIRVRVIPPLIGNPYNG